MQTEDQLMHLNHYRIGKFSSINSCQGNDFQNYSFENVNFQTDINMIVPKINQTNQQQDHQKQAHFNEKEYNDTRTYIIHENFAYFEHQNGMKIEIQNEKKENHHIKISYINQTHTSLSLLPEQIIELKNQQNQHLTQFDEQKPLEKDHEQKIESPILTKKQMEEQKSHLEQLKEKKKEEQRKRLLQKMQQQQKQRLEKLRQQTRQFQQMKKQKNKEIMQYKNQLQNLKKSKEKQVIKQKHKEQMHELNVARQKQHQYYKAVMEEKERLAQQMNRKNQELKQKKIEEEQALRKQQERMALINSTSYQQMLREKQQKQEEERRKVEEIKHLLRRNSYQQKLRNLQLQIMKEKPKPVKQKSQMQLRQEERRLNTKSLSAAQIYRMGQEFMEEAHSNIDEILIEQSKVDMSNAYNSLRQSTRTEYKDYLREEKLRREKFFKSTGKLHANPQIRELKKLIVKEQNSPQKLLKAKLITQRFDSKVIKKPCLKLKADSIAAKLKIIKEFT